jgi:poly(3-hydroxyalkanoate) synthetase
VREITGHHGINLIGFCAGGIIATTLLNHLSAIEDDRTRMSTRHSSASQPPRSPHFRA